MSAALEIEELSISFPVAGQRVRVVDEVTLQIQPGEVLALVGESGSGKSMIALGCLRLVPKPGRVDAGRVLLHGRDLMPLSVPEMRKLRGASLAMIFQEPMTSLSPVVTVGEQVAEAILLHEKVTRKAAHARCVELFERVGIPDAGARTHAYPHQLSGGLKQRVMIAMALSTRPRVLIADEPTTALDVTIQAQILELLRELQRETDSAILLITHDFGIVNELADRVAVLYAGRLVEEAPRETLLHRPRHPYTQGLLRSMPGSVVKGERLEEIAGTLPPLTELPAGCRFATRCARVFEPCHESTPASLQLAPEHSAFCFAVAEEEGG